MIMVSYKKSVIKDNQQAETMTGNVQQAHKKFNWKTKLERIQHNNSTITLHAHNGIYRFFGYDYIPDDKYLSLTQKLETRHKIHPHFLTLALGGVHAARNPLLNLTSLDSLHIGLRLPDNQLS